MKSQDVSEEAAKHPRPGRPRRPDWRFGRSLISEPLGTVVLAEVGFVNQRLQMRVVEHLDDGSTVVEPVGASGLHVSTGHDGRRRIFPDDVKRYRVVYGEWKPGDFVVLVGVPEDEWRAVVVESIGLEVIVDTATGRDFVFDDEIESAWSRVPKMPRLKPGPMSSDPVAERVGSEAILRILEDREGFVAVDPEGYAL